MFKEIFFFLLFVSTTTNETQYSDLIVKRENELNYCSRQFLAIEMLKKACSYFWKQAKRNVLFRKTLIAEVGRLDLTSDKKIYEFWRDCVISQARGEFSKITAKFDETYTIIERNLLDFYAVMQAISQRLDFSNPIYEPLILSLIYEVSMSIGELNENYPYRLPTLNPHKVKIIILKAKQYEINMKRANYDIFRFEEASAGQMNVLKERIKSYIQEGTKVKSSEDITFDDVCYSNGHSSHFLYNPRGFNGTICAKDFNYCYPRYLYNPKIEQNPGGKIFTGKLIN